MLDVDDLAGPATATAFVNEPNVLSRYPTIIYQTGNNYLRNGQITSGGVVIPTPPTGLDMDRLVEYVNGGGRIIAFGQDLAAATGGSTSSPPFFYSSVLGAKYLGDSVSGNQVFTATTQSLVGIPGAPLADFNFDISARGDGADNQRYVDEIQVACKDPDSPENCAVYRPLLKYGEPASFAADGTVALSHSDEPTLERPGITFPGRALYFAFGLEGVNNDTGADTREELLGTAMKWGLDQPSVTITPAVAPPGQVTYLVAALQSPVGAAGVSYRWDFGDGSPLTETYASATAGHTYANTGVYWVRVEATDSLGHKVVGQQTVVVNRFGAGSYILLPLIYR